MKGWARKYFAVFVTVMMMVQWFPLGLVAMADDTADVSGEAAPGTGSPEGGESGQGSNPVWMKQNATYSFTGAGIGFAPASGAIFNVNYEPGVLPGGGDAGAVSVPDSHLLDFDEDNDVYLIPATAVASLGTYRFDGWLYREISISRAMEFRKPWLPAM